MTLPFAQLLGADNWPKSFSSDCARSHEAHRFLSPLVEGGVQPFIANVHVELGAILVGAQLLPLTRHSGAECSSYVASLATHYVHYAREELRQLPSPLLRSLLRPALAALESLMSWGESDKIIFVDNWMVSTNLHPHLSQVQLEQILETLISRYPDHLIAFRSVEHATCPRLFDTLRQLDFVPLLSRQVYLFRPDDPMSWRKKDLKNDLRLLKNTSYEVVGGEAFSPDDAGRIEELYNALYLDHYSRLNPQYTARFFEHMRKNGLLEFRGLRSERGSLDAVLGFFELNSVMTTPLFGYDFSVPRQAGLYRLLSTLLALEAKERGNLLHQSSGAAEFKRLRGARPEPEYTMIYEQHLPARRRLPIKSLAALSLLGEVLRHRFAF